MNNRFIDILSSTYVKYNANNRGTSTGDCVNRALSMAFDVDYVKVNQELNAKKKELRAHSWKIPRVYGEVIKEHGGSQRHLIGESSRCSLSEWIDSNANQGTWLVETGGKRTGSSDHIVCVVDGKIYDSWDSSDQYVYGYYECPHNAINSTGIEEAFPELVNSVAVPTMQELGSKFISKYGWQVADFEVGSKCKRSGFSFKVPYYITVKVPIQGRQTYSDSGEIAFVFKPSTTYDEAVKKIKEVAKVRLYDKFYAVNKAVNEITEEYSIREAVSNDYTPMYMNGMESKFYNSLPGWARGLLIRMYINQPGQYSDSYDLKFKALPDDPDQDPVYVYGYDSRMVKGELEMYKKDFSRPGDDYDPYELW